MLEGHPAIHEFFGFDRRWKKLSVFGRLFKELSLLKKIRQEKYDLVINLTEGDRGAIAAWVSGAKIKSVSDLTRKEKGLKAKSGFIPI
jgi:heptosyltransferase-3